MTVRMDDADVRLYTALADGDLGLYLGAFAEIALEGQPTALWREAGEDWRRTTDSLDSLAESDYLILKAGLHDLDDADPDRIPGLQRLLEQLATARAIATCAHAGQVDKNGEPYLGHPARVAARVTTLRGQAAAWVHDVVEDTKVSADDLRAAGVDAKVIAAVLVLTRRPDVPDTAYYRRIRSNPVAREVKLADIADNLDPTRTVRLDPEVRARLAQKYDHARRALGAEEERA